MRPTLTIRLPWAVGLSNATWWKWGLLLLTVAACYAPGLKGGYAFDDDVNILQNSSLRLHSLQWDGLWSAAWSGDAGPLGRPIALVTFALNLYFGGTDPYYFKLINLLIHLVNVLLVGALAQTLCDAFEQKSTRTTSIQNPNAWSGWVVASIWGLHPLNLTAVLYVVQRMTSLSACFGFAALLIFCRYRIATTRGRVGRRPYLALLGRVPIVLALLAASVLTKESGLLFVVLLIWVEYFAFRFRYRDRPLVLYGVRAKRLISGALLLAGAAVLIFKLPTMLAPAAFANRDFDLKERVFTESRVLFYYLQMIFLPRASGLSLYHDDFTISRSFWDPLTTAFSIWGLALISAGAVVLRRRLPLLLFAWGWFLIAHSLESTIFPLELVHEHRNYFAMFGLFLLVSIGFQEIRAIDKRRLAMVLLTLYLGLLAFVTYNRSLQWSNVVDWAANEAENRPSSPRANYELARNYMVLFQNTGDDRFGALADEALVRSTQSYLPTVLPFLARVHLAYFRGLEPDPSLLSSVISRFRDLPYYNTNTGALNSFMACQIEKTCRLPDDQALSIFKAALDNPLIPRDQKAEVTKILAQYYINKYGDLPRGAALISAAIAMNDEASSRIMYAQALAFLGKFADGLVELDVAQSMDRKGVYRRRIDEERSAMRHALANQ
jgi:protein O-mannosyl-transferase